MDRGRCGPDPGERVSVEGGALEPGSGRSTVDPGAQMDKNEHNRSGTPTLRLTSKVACGQVHRVWITRSSGSRSHLVTAAPGEAALVPPTIGPLRAARAQSPHRARRYMHRRGPVLGHCRPGPPRVTPASAHCPPRGSPHVSQRDTRDVDPGAEVGEGGVLAQIRPTSGSQEPCDRSPPPCRRACGRGGPPAAPPRGCPLRARDSWAAPQRGPPLGVPPSQVRPLWGARLPSVGGAPKYRKGDFPRGQSRCRPGLGTGEAPPRDGGCALRGLGNPGWPGRVDD
jgi:hypothetical protein